MAEPAAILARLDAIMRELAELREAVVSALPAPVVEGNSLDADDLSDANLLDTWAAQERFGYPRNTLALWCRKEGLGIRRGDRWWVSVPRLQRRLNGNVD